MKRSARGLVPASAFVFMAWLSWLKWPDAYVDIGRSLYVPWRISQGDHLYRDITSWMGPLPAYLNSILFRVFGSSLFLVEVVNLISTALIAYIIFRYFDDPDDPVPGPLCSTVFILVFAFSQFFWTGNFNFAAPYSEELVMGMTLSFLALYFLRAFVMSRRGVWLYATGFLTGCVLLTKMEVALAASSAVFASVAIIFAFKRPRARTVLAFLGSVVAPVVFFALYLSLYMPTGDALSGIFGAWMAVFSTDVVQGAYQMSVMGTDDVLGNLKTMALVGLCYLILIGPFMLSFALRGGSRPLVYRATAFVVAAGVVAILWARVDWFEVMRPLPIFALLAVIVSFKTVIRDGSSDWHLEKTLPMFAFSVFALVLLFKILLNVHVFHYGFALAMPAAVLVVYIISGPIARRVHDFAGEASIFREAFVGALAIVLLWHVAGSYRVYSVKDYVIGSGLDSIVGFNPAIKPEALGVDMAIKELKGLMKPGETLSVLPEGVVMNYMLRAKDPAGFLSYGPSEQVIFGEGRMLDALTRKSPDWVVLVHMDTSDYGLRFFGTDYGERLISWVRANYTPVHRIGAEPNTTDEFGVLILKRNEQRS